MPNITIRPATPNDNPTILALLRELDHRSLNIDTFEQIYVLMGHALPEEAPACPVQ
jgi:N-acetylglutamate synthase-like GNAT family acetyltransferase